MLYSSPRPRVVELTQPESDRTRRRFCRARLEAKWLRYQHCREDAARQRWDHMVEQWLAAYAPLSLDPGY